eukprot:gene9616-biopygen1868
MEVKEDCLSYITFWLNSIIIHTQNEKGEVAPIFFVGTRKDLMSSPTEHLQISTKLYEGFSGSLAWPYVVENVGAEGPNGKTDLCFYPINNMLSNHDSTMQILLKKIEETIDSSSYVHVERPLSWFRVIDALKEANVPYMRYKEAERIITGCDIPENKVSLLLRFLHEMGILMWHDEDKLREVVVFDPIEYFVKPATIMICKHVPDEADGEDNEGVMFIRLDQVRAVVDKKTALSMNVRGGRSLLNVQEAMKLYDAWLVDYTVFDEYDTFISYRWAYELFSSYSYS